CMPVRFRDELVIIPSGTFQPDGLIINNNVAVSGLWPCNRLAAHTLRQIPQQNKALRGAP
ncbi:hypothetical protein, partial [Parashewanella spongiae]|uniref:hypothetical protein n=1 Tax=Parashewanella spongiae TaxID=342950 RepID=UPI001AA00A45